MTLKPCGVEVKNPSLKEILEPCHTGQQIGKQPVKTTSAHHTTKLAETGRNQSG